MAQEELYRGYGIEGDGDFNWVYEREAVEIELRSGEKLRVYVKGVGRNWILAEDGRDKIVINKNAIAYIRVIR